MCQTGAGADGAGGGVQRGAADAVVQTERSQDAAGRAITCCSASIPQSAARRDARSAAPFTGGEKLAPRADGMFAKFQLCSHVERREDEDEDEDEEGTDLSRLSTPT